MFQEIGKVNKFLGGTSSWFFDWKEVMIQWRFHRFFTGLGKFFGVFQISSDVLKWLHWLIIGLSIKTLILSASSIMLEWLSVLHIFTLFLFSIKSWMLFFNMLEAMFISLISMRYIIKFMKSINFLFFFKYRSVALLTFNYRGYRFI